MIIGALWYIDQWNKNPLGGGLARGMMASSSSEGEMVPAALMYSLATAGVPAVHIAGMPYHTIAQKSYDMLEYAERTDSMWRSQIPKLASRKGMLRLGAKVGGRVVPGLGWALFALDMWYVGKWIGEKTNPFDS
jgi:hypothetical protein